MRIIAKFILSSIKEKKFRTFLLLFAITLSSALFFASNALNLTLQDMYSEVMKKYYGTSTIVIRQGKGSGWTLSTEKAELHLDRLEYVICSIDDSWQFKPNNRESVSFSVRGFKIEDLDRFSPVSIEEKGELYPFVGRKMIVCATTAAKYGWKIGDFVDMELQYSKKRFLIVGIAQPTGVFQAGFDRNESCVVPRDYLANRYGIRGRVTVVYVRTRTDADIPDMIRTLAKEYPRYNVRQPLDAAEREQFVNNIRTPLFLMSLLVLLMSVFIVYSTFKVITVERLPMIGTFRSIGAARKTTDLVLIVETLAYGVAGGLLGCILGIGILAAMTGLMAYNPWAGFTMKSEIHFTAFHLLSAFLLAVALSFVGSIVPIIKIARIPVKDIVLNAVDHKPIDKKARLALGLALLAVAIVVPLFIPKGVALPVSASCLIASGIAVITLVPVITSFLVRGLERLYLVVFGNEGVLAARNLRENKNILNNIALLSLSISSLILIFTISFSAVKSIVGFYTDARFGIWLWAYQADRKLEPSLLAVPGVTGIGHVISASNVRTDRDEIAINLVHGIDTSEYQDYWDLRIPTGLLERLDEGRNILLTNIIAKKLGVKTGDILTLELKNGKKKYKVIGFFSSTRNNGSFALVSGKYLKSDTGARFYEDIYVKTDESPAETAVLLKTKLSRRYPWISTIAEMQENALKSNAQLMTLLQGFAVMTLIMGVFGVLNNFIISFVERRRHLAIFRSVGMSRKQIVKMMLMESLTGGLVGGIAGSAGGAIAVFIAVYLLEAMDIHVAMSVSPAVFGVCVAASILISLVASVGPAFKSGRLDIIGAIKYE